MNPPYPINKEIRILGKVMTRQSFSIYQYIGLLWHIFAPLLEAKRQQKSLQHF